MFGSVQTFIISMIVARHLPLDPPVCWLSVRGGRVERIVLGRQRDVVRRRRVVDERRRLRQLYVPRRPGVLSAAAVSAAQRLCLGRQTTRTVLPRLQRLAESIELRFNVLPLRTNCQCLPRPWRHALGQLSLASLRGRLIEYQLRLG